MAHEHSIFYRKTPSRYSVNIYQYDSLRDHAPTEEELKDDDSKNIKPIVSFCCLHCKMWDTCETESKIIDQGHKRDVCYVAKEIETKLSHLSFGFSSGLSSCDFMVVAESLLQKRSVDKIRKHILRKYKTL